MSWKSAAKSCPAIFLKNPQYIVYDFGQAVTIELVADWRKAAIAAIKRGSVVIKYGFPIGVATADIAPGSDVHSHNDGRVATRNEIWIIPAVGVRRQPRVARIGSERYASQPR